VYDASGRLIDASQGAENSEKITLTLTAGEAIFVKVVGFDNAVNAEYALSIDVDGTLVLPDAWESNDNFATASHLDPLTQTITDLSLHSETDEDYFRWTSPASGRLTLKSTFDHDPAHVELSVYDMLHSLIGESTSKPGLAELAIDVVHGQLLYFRVANASATSLPGYELAIALAPLLHGDTDHNGQVDVTDLNAVRNHFGANGEHLAGDADFDGDVDVTDLNAVRNNFGGSLPEETMVAAVVAIGGQAERRSDVFAVDLLARIETPTHHLSDAIRDFFDARVRQHFRWRPSPGAYDV